MKRDRLTELLAVCCLLYGTAVFIRGTEWKECLPVICVKQAASEAVMVLNGERTPGEIISVFLQSEEEGENNAVSVSAPAKVEKPLE